MCVSVERLLIVSNLTKSISNQFIRQYRIEKMLFLIIIILFLINMHYLIYFNLGQVERNENSDSNIDLIKSMNIQNILNEIKVRQEQKAELNITKIFNSQILTELKFEILQSNNNDLSIKLSVNDQSKTMLCYSFDNVIYQHFMVNVWIYIDSSLYSVY
jgi:hypothetical protein